MEEETKKKDCQDIANKKKSIRNRLILSVVFGIFLIYIILSPNYFDAFNKNYSSSCSALSTLREVEEAQANSYNESNFKEDIFSYYNFDYDDDIDDIFLSSSECIANYIGDCKFGVLCSFSGYFSINIGNMDPIKSPVTIVKKFNYQR